MKSLLFLLISVPTLILLASPRPQAQRARFEVASIKPTTVLGPINTGPNGRFIAAGQSLKSLIGYAYRLRDFQVVGGPSWITHDLWQIEAKAEEGTFTPARRSFSVADAMKIDSIAIMLQSLLEDRFQLKVHQEVRDLPVYELVIANGGPKIQLSDDQAPLQKLEEDVQSTFTGPLILKRGMSRLARRPNGMQFEGKAIALDLFINTLINVTNQTIIDRTGLTGLYDIKIQWTPETMQAPLSATVDAPLPASPTSGPSLTIAIQEQLGLRLMSTKAPLSVLVVDGARRSSEN